MALFSRDLKLPLHFNLELLHVTFFPCAAMFSYPETVLIIPNDF